MFFLRNSVLVAHGTLAMMAARVLAVCLCHGSMAPCADEDCHAAHENAVCAAEHHAHEHACVCEADVAAHVPLWRFVKDIPSAPVFAMRADAADWAPLKIPWRWRVEKPPPGLALKKITQRLC